MKYCFHSVVCLAVLTVAAFGHDIITTKLTYTRDISRILTRRCIACHDSGSSIPLTNYQEVRPWAVSIKEQVLARSMPPWGAVKGFGTLMPDNSLSQEEMMIIASWVIGGAPNGDPALLPKATRKDQPAISETQDVLTVTNKAVIRNLVAVTGIRPLTETMIDSARIVAFLPDGRIEPLIWLYHFDPKWSHAFHFRKPIALAAGTRVESSAPLRFALQREARALSPGQ